MKLIASFTEYTFTEAAPQQKQQIDTLVLSLSSPIFVPRFVVVKRKGHIHAAQSPAGCDSLLIGRGVANSVFPI